MIVTPVSMPTNSSRWVGSVPSDAGTGLLPGQRAGQAEDEHIGRNRPSSITMPERGVVPGGVHRDAGERAAVVVRRRGERVQHLGQPVRAGVEHAGPFTGQRHRQRRAGQHQRRRGQQVQRGELQLPSAEFLAQVLRRSPDHQPGDEHRDHRQDQHAVQARSGAAGRDLAEHHVQQRRAAAEAGVRVVEAVHRTGRRQRRRRSRTPPSSGTPNRVSVPFGGRPDRGRHRAVVRASANDDAQHDGQRAR